MISFVYQSVSLTQTIIQDILRSVSRVHVPGRDELAQRVTDLKGEHMEKIKKVVTACFPQFGIIMDGTPLFAEAECLVIRLVHKKTFKIYQLLIHLQLYNTSLDGADIAQHVKDAVAQDLGLQLKNLRAVSIDRAKTNVKALKDLEKEDRVKAFQAFCVPHGLSNCGKESSLTVGEEVIKAVTGMVKYSLCKARTLFLLTFKEPAKKRSGVRWGVEHELVSQLDRLGVQRLVNEYASVCSKNKWSENSANKLINSVDDPIDLAVAMVELAAVADVGQPLVSETYTCESDQPMIFTAHECFDRLNDLFANGVNGFEAAGGFDRLYERAVEASQIMYFVEVSVYCFVCYFQLSVSLT